jgi:DNA-binding CsgD family transcriptional regulator
MYNAELFWLGARLAADLAERARLVGDAIAAEQAVEIAASATAEFDRVIGLAPGDGAPPEGLAFRELAEAELARLRGEHDAERWHGAGERFRGLGEALRAAYADFRTAEAVALSGGRQAEIAAPLRTAFEVARSLAAKPFRAEVEALARRTGIVLESSDGGRAVAPAEFGLSDRELEVLRLIAEGRTNRQIGEQLFITTKTASAHVSHILMKLGVTNRAEAAAAAHRLGLTGSLRAE